MPGSSSIHFTVNSANWKRCCRLLCRSKLKNLSAGESWHMKGKGKNAVKVFFNVSFSPVVVLSRRGVYFFNKRTAECVCMCVLFVFTLNFPTMPRRRIVLLLLVMWGSWEKKGKQKRGWSIIDLKEGWWTMIIHQGRWEREKEDKCWHRPLTHTNNVCLCVRLPHTHTDKPNFSARQIDDPAMFYK